MKVSEFDRNLYAKTLSPALFLILFSLINTAVFNSVLAVFAWNHLAMNSINGMITLFAVFLVVFSFTLHFFTLTFLVSKRLTKFFIVVVLLCNSAALYFMVTYQVILDKSMMGNLFNTNIEEASSYLSASLLLYILLLGALPAYLFAKLKVKSTGKMKVTLLSSLLFLCTFLWLIIFSSTWLWFDEYGKQLGAKVLPWSYIANSVRYQSKKMSEHKEAVLLPDGQFGADTGRQLVVLVIGETARANNFAQYGYSRNTSPRLVQENAVALSDTSSCTSYTTGSMRCILSHKDSGSEFSTLYEPLPSYLSRHGVDVIWRSNNWGEPNLDVDTYESATDLRPDCTDKHCQLDEVLLTNLSERVVQSKADKIFVALHLKGSHGPNYFERYPEDMEKFTPVCRSVELSECTHEELINAYDNSLVYTDYVLSRLIKTLKQTGLPALMLYISDHGESLGEYGLYLHGTPKAFAPSYQTQVPFFVWMSKSFRDRNHLFARPHKQANSHSQSNIFHTVLGAFQLKSPVYRDDLNILREFAQ